MIIPMKSLIVRFRYLLVILFLFCLILAGHLRSRNLLVREIRAERMGELTSFFDQIGARVEQNLQNAWQMVRVMEAHGGALIPTVTEHERFLLSMFEAVQGTPIYGLGIWYEEGMGPGGGEFFGPYVHGDPENPDVRFLTYQWQDSAYNYREQDWYRHLLAVNAGEVGSTEPYFDTDYNYVTFGGPFFREGRKAGVVSVDLVLPGFSRFFEETDLSVFRNLTLYSPGGRVLYSTVSTPPPREEETFPVRDSGELFFSSVLPMTDWTLQARADSSLLSREEVRSLRIQGLVLLLLWLVISTVLHFRWTYRRQKSTNTVLASENTQLKEEIQRREKVERELEASRNELAGMNEHLGYLAYHDQVTALPNNMALLERIDKMAPQVRERSFVILLLAHNLRELSGVFDRDLIDHMLKTLADRLAEICGPDFSVFRGSGFSFHILTPEIEEPALRPFLEILAGEFRHPVTVLTTHLRIRMRIGVSDLCRLQEPSEALTRAASALSLGGERKGGDYAFFTEFHRQQKNRFLVLDAALLEETLLEELSPVFQPIVDIRNGEIRGFETLVRWNSPDLGSVSPGEFIPLAEENGRILDIGWFILEQALDFLAAVPAAPDRDWFVTVNVSPLQFFQQEFIEKLEQRIGSLKISKSRLRLEITESDIVANDEVFWKTVQQLQELGYRFAIDDFGIGQSSLSRLNSFHFDMLKIDRSFISDILSNRRNRQLIQSILSLADSLGSNSVAEGIETEEQKELLMSLGCPLAQGFLFYRPLTREQISLLPSGSL